MRVSHGGGGGLAGLGLGYARPISILLPFCHALSLCFVLVSSTYTLCLSFLVVRTVRSSLFYCHRETSNAYGIGLVCSAGGTCAPALLTPISVIGRIVWLVWALRKNERLRRFKFKFIYSHLVNYNTTTIRKKKERSKNTANYTLN